MTKLVKGQTVYLPNGRTGAVIEVDDANNKVWCTIDPPAKHTGSGGATPTAWFDLEDVKPVSKREDSVQAAKRVVDVATADEDDK